MGKMHHVRIFFFFVNSCSRVSETQGVLTQFVEFSFLSVPAALYALYCSLHTCCFPPHSTIKEKFLPLLLFSTAPPRSLAMPAFFIFFFFSASVQLCRRVGGGGGGRGLCACEKGDARVTGNILTFSLLFVRTKNFTPGACREKVTWDKQRRQPHFPPPPPPPPKKFL